MNMTPNLFDLIQEAHQMLMDRPPEERELIYAVASLTSEERAAIILAYQTMKGEECQN